MAKCRQPDILRKVEYIVEGSKYSLSYQDLVSDYWRFRGMTDAEFISSANEIVHFACVVGYLKELPASCVLSDKGIIHQLIHLLNHDTHDGAKNEIEQIREVFNSVCQLT